ncbi:hypothetical protein F5051DRAFT_302377, partial [Lentinula edodes]
MNAFITAILRYDSKSVEQNCLGVFGHVKGYYGCVEAQGRGSLHCHMLIWLEGGMNPNEIKNRILHDPSSDFQQRMVSFLDDTICNHIPVKPAVSVEVPSDKFHLCALRSNLVSGFDVPTMQSEDANQKDLCNLVQYCQVHNHTSTCYKYCKPGEPKTCRFGLDPSNVKPVTFFDPDTGELTMRCLDGLVNNFNETILRAIRCNMDIKFIGSGASAKAVLYYITNYITKSQLKAHVAYAALERAVVKLGTNTSDDTPLILRSKKLLQKCAYSMISEQEISAQQVATYLLGFDINFTSHKYAFLFWTSFESFIEHQRPSPECKTSITTNHTARHADDNDENSEDDCASCSECESNTNVADNTPVRENGDEVHLDVSKEGTLITKASQVEDYCYR